MFSVYSYLSDWSQPRCISAGTALQSAMDFLHAPQHRHNSASILHINAHSISYWALPLAMDFLGVPRHRHIFAGNIHANAHGSLYSALPLAKDFLCVSQSRLNFAITIHAKVSLLCPTHLTLKHTTLFIRPVQTVLLI